MSDSASIILSVDIGSTVTHIAAVDTGQLQCVDRIDFDNSDFDADFGATVKNLAAAHPQIRIVAITSCVRSLSTKAQDFCINDMEGRFDAVESVRPRDGLPVRFHYENPNTLGTDRVCNALACAALFKGANCVIVDAGTAITVDCLRGGEFFEGGAILPGCAMQFRALRDGTDSLPLIDVGVSSGGAAASLPSMSTLECIKAGVLYGTAGAVDRCVDECLRSLGGNGAMIATGGGWELIRPLVARAATTIPDLTLIGAGIYMCGK